MGLLVQDGNGLGLQKSGPGDPELERCKLAIRKIVAQQANGLAEIAGKFGGLLAMRYGLSDEAGRTLGRFGPGHSLFALFPYWRCNCGSGSGVPSSIVQAFGRWASGAFFGYVRPNAHTFETVSSSLNP